MADEMNPVATYYRIFSKQKVDYENTSLEREDIVRATVYFSSYQFYFPHLIKFERGNRQFTSTTIDWLAYASERNETIELAISMVDSYSFCKL